jgi:V/A-type H+-transporting ATPase subunit E
MSNKLQELTDKLYNEGLSKGKREAESVLETAKAEAANILAEARRKAGDIEAAAKKQAEEIKSNAEAEIKLAGRQIVNDVKQSVENMILTGAVATDVKRAFDDTGFVKSLISSALTKFNPSGSNPSDLLLLVPEEQKQDFAEYLNRRTVAGLETKTDDTLKAGFKIGVRNDGYYIGFTDEDFASLFKSSLRPKVSELLFG